MKLLFWLTLHEFSSKSDSFITELRSKQFYWGQRSRPWYPNNVSQNDHTTDAELENKQYFSDIFTLFYMYYIFVLWRISKNWVGSIRAEYIQCDTPHYITFSHCDQIGNDFTFMAGSQWNKKNNIPHWGASVVCTIYVCVGLIRSTLTLFSPSGYFSDIIVVLATKPQNMFLLLQFNDLYYMYPILN